MNRSATVTGVSFSSIYTTASYIIIIFTELLHVFNNDFSTLRVSNFQIIMDAALASNVLDIPTLMPPSGLLNSTRGSQ